MFMKLKYTLYMVFSVIAVLFTAYRMGGRAVKKALQIKHHQDDNIRLSTTIEVKKEVDNEVRQMEDGGANNELRNSWMRK